MNRIPETDILSCAPTLRAGGVVVLRTDTIYGIVARADDQAACRRVYAAKGRDGSKPCIVLVADSTQIWDTVSREAFARGLSTVGDEPTSVVVPAGDHVPVWLPHEDGSVAFRKPNKPGLQELLAVTGPLIAPSANPSGEEPAANTEQAEAYFGEAVDVYVDGGEVENPRPSRVVRIDETGELERIR